MISPVRKRRTVTTIIREVIFHMAASTREPSAKKPCGNGEKNVLSRKSIINRLNFLNFTDQRIQCHMDPEDGEGDVTVNLKPLPSFGNYLVCLWPEERVRDADPAACRMKKISIPDAGENICIAPDIRRLTRKGLCVRLPDPCDVCVETRGEHPLFRDLKVRINHNGMSMTGDIVRLGDDFLSIILPDPSSEGVPDFEVRGTVPIAFVKDGEILFMGRFIVLTIEIQNKKTLITLKPESQIINRFPPKKHRSSRHRLTPSPDAVFTHPFTGRQLTLPVQDLSGSGFSVRSEGEEAMLLPGMTLRNMRLSFAGVFSLSCCVQAVHRKEETAVQTTDRAIIYGFALVDMPLTDHLKLQTIMHQCEDTHSKVCHSLNPEELWRFFFETGFIYSRKYQSFMENKALIRDTYTKLYSRNPDIARHFTYQEKGGILGHLSMLRFYSNAWLIHHHAALKKSSVKAGLSVLNQVARFSYNSLWLDACRMRYMFCYFRPENPFPNYFFNGFAENLNDRKGCSTDAFAYHSYRKPADGGGSLPPSWKIGPCTTLDLSDLSRHYEKKSGGLMIEALDLSPDSTPSPELEKAYQDAGLTREKHLFSLRFEGDLTAVILVNIADIAINMSDLTSSVTVLVLKENLVRREILTTVLSTVSDLFTRKRFPVLLYPAAYAEKQAIAFQKTYTLWILDTRYSDHYFDYLEQVNRQAPGHH